MDENNSHIIPAMTHPLSKHWEQPKRENILVDDTHALMNMSDFLALGTYSTTRPAGVYEGKMWKGVNLRGWYLAWYDVSKEPDLCSVESRDIIIVGEKELSPKTKGLIASLENKIRNELNRSVRLRV